MTFFGYLKSVSSSLLDSYRPANWVEKVAVATAVTVAICSKNLGSMVGYGVLYGIYKYCQVDEPQRHKIEAPVSKQSPSPSKLSSPVQTLVDSVHAAATPSLPALPKPEAVAPPSTLPKSAPSSPVKAQPNPVKAAATKSLPTLHASLPPPSKPVPPVSQPLPPKPPILHPIELPSIGIPNQGNTCFLASIMQASILRNPILEAAFLDPEVRKVMPNTAQFIEEFRRDQKAGKKETSADISNIRLDLIAVSENPKWQVGQHDVHEALQTLLTSRVMLQALNRARFSLTQTTRLYWELPEGRKPVEKAGEQPDLYPDRETKAYFSSSETVSTCEEVIGLTPSDGGQSIESLLVRSFESPHEDIIGRKFNTVDANGRIENRDVTFLYAQTKWDKATPHLSLVLKRYQAEMIDDVYVRARIDVPIVVKDRIVLDGALYLDQTPKTYELTSFIEQIPYGGLDSGHYVAYVKENGQWFRCSDANKTPVSEQELGQARNRSYCFNWALR